MLWGALKPNAPIMGLSGPLVTTESLGKALRHEYAALIEQEIAHDHIQARDVITCGQPELPETPQVDPVTFLPLLRLASLPDCRIQFSLVPPGRGASLAYVELVATEAPIMQGALVYSGPLETCPRFWSSPRLPFVARIWNEQNDHANGRQPAKEEVGVLVRPADTVILDLEAS